ncbi:glutamyl-tRNA reductase [Campylobacter sp. VicNov18]|uniref:glutamyl-tRNA reductase n=1 Tax=Campylobacter bilis TaxID=2691918 RepID=UPI00130E1D3D|nr:glutamyl-tRNA reductase [Campylobacter bilis]MPV64125.1 glutamyl-tRNA reductase [Campylobacter hepaticus]MBM0637628.1 glutamyl-tRNA reductase [Campylobacter bilis]MCC8278354.1 glutamyl-tRNA reductase [Campylobacter bilis]MCC8299857.1 glutamyl-tRNA reductase [Campylobacter bilis]MCC8301263.1 glutamyl-tRNA reductase [Campylobacter bilis]
MYYCISFTHKNTDLALREKLSFSDEKKKKEFLKIVKTNENIDECLLISTCNRVEIVAFVKTLCAEFIIASLALLCDSDKKILLQKADIFQDQAAIHHLFSVASSLDSLVVGETQIAGQLKDAFVFALENNFCAIHLSRALHSAFKCAAKVRNETQISKNPISVASVAVTKAKELANLSQKQVIIIGAGEMGELAARHLIAAGARVIILNRNLQKAKDLCEKLGTLSQYDSLENLKQYLNQYEFFFSATNASYAIITSKLLQDLPYKRYFFDLAVPRDIDLNESENICVFSVDDLKLVVQKNLALREQEARMAYSIIGNETAEFFSYLNDLALAPIIKAIRLQAKQYAHTQLELALKKGYLKKSDKEEARKLIHQVFKAFLHKPTMNLKQLQGKVQSDTVINAMRYVFDLKTDLEGLNQYKCEFNMENNDEMD